MPDFLQCISWPICQRMRFFYKKLLKTPTSIFKAIMKYVFITKTYRKYWNLTVSLKLIISQNNPFGMNIFTKELNILIPASKGILNHKITMYKGKWAYKTKSIGIGLTQRMTEGLTYWIKNVNATHALNMCLTSSEDLMQLTIIYIELRI